MPGDWCAVLGVTVMGESNPTRAPRYQDATSGQLSASSGPVARPRRSTAERRTACRVASNVAPGERGGHGLPARQPAGRVGEVDRGDQALELGRQLVELGEQLRRILRRGIALLHDRAVLQARADLRDPLSARPRRNVNASPSRIPGSVASPAVFTPFHRGGSGPPLVLLHGFFDTWRVWELVLPALERERDVLALTLAGHAGGPPLPAVITDHTLADAAERTMAEPDSSSRRSPGTRSAVSSRSSSPSAGSRAGWSRSRPPGAGRRSRTCSPSNARCTMHSSARARDVDQRAGHPLHDGQLRAHPGRAARAPDARRRGDRRAADARVRRARAVADRRRADRLPVRIVWGTEDRCCPGPRPRPLPQGLPHADWVELEGVGHCPQLDVPLETAQLIL
jgi:pimeloyl-ACP methyl ester carboxylesterase